MVIRKKDETDMPHIKNIQAYADHVAQFSLAGIHKIRAELGKKSFSKRSSAERGKQ